MTTPASSPPPPAEGAPTATPQATQVASGQQSSEISQLVDQLAKPDIPFDPATIRKGTIAASNPTNTPPDVSLTISGDDTTTVDAVRYLDSYSPVVGDTVLIIKQGTDIVVLGQINDGGTGTASGWITPTPLGTGFSNNGNSNGNPSYRLVVDNGDLKIQWKGSVAKTGTATALFTMPTGFRPASKRSMLTGRDPDGGSNSVQLDFNSDGTIVVIGGTTVPSGTGTTGASASLSHQHSLGTTDFQICGYLSKAGSDLCHAHGMGSSDFQLGTHTHTMGNLAVTFPVWITLNGVEYFL